jgi:transcriptional regulator with XRE-family HTH domain
VHGIGAVPTLTAMSRKPHDNEILRRLAHNLTTLREKRGLTRGQLNRRCTFTTGFVRDIEGRMKNPSVANIEALSLGLDCTTYDLLKPVK